MSTPNDSNHQLKNPQAGNATRNLSLLLCLGALAGILIWAKLRLVTDIPRSAYAVPREEHNAAEEEDSSGELILEESSDPKETERPREPHP